MNTFIIKKILGNDLNIDQLDLIDEITIGRSDTCDIVIPQDQSDVSRKHGMIRKKGDDLYYIDTSRNGSKINGKRIVNDEVILHHDDSIQVGDIIFKIETQNKKDDTVSRIIDLEKDKKNSIKEPLIKNAEKPKKGDDSILSNKYFKIIALILIGILSITLFIPDNGDDSDDGSGDEVIRPSNDEIPEVTIIGNTAPDTIKTKIINYVELARSEKKAQITDKSLWNARYYYRKAIIMANKYIVKPDEYQTYLAEYDSVIEDINIKFSSLKSNVILLKKQGETYKKNREIDKILKLIPDPEDSRYLWAVKMRSK